MINIFYEEIEALDLNPEFFNLWLTDLCLLHNASLGEVTVIFCSDEYLLKVNQQYLEHDYYTDIITFDYTENDVVSGDLFISTDRVKENAMNLGVPFLNELNRVVAHGTLHLLGFKDKSEADEVEMRKQEDIALGLIVSRGTI